MKDILTALTLVSLLLVGSVLFAHSSQAAPAPAPAPAPSVMVIPTASVTVQTHAECLQACLNQLTQNLAACKPACWVCSFWILWICTAGAYDQTCLNICHAAADTVHTACVAACLPDPRPAG